MMNENDKRLIEENMDKLEITIKSIALKFNIGYAEFEDYRQMAYLTVCNKVHKYDGSTKFTTFADMVITHALIDKYRREKNKNLDTISLDDVCFEGDEDAKLMDFLASESNTENKVLAKVTDELIKKYIRDEKHKCSAHTTVRGFEALELKLAGYSGEEIANMFNVPSNSLRSWMSRAKKILLSQNEFVELVRG